MLGWKRKVLMSFPSVFTSWVGRRKMSPARPWRLLVLPVTNTWQKVPARMLSIWEWECIHSMCWESTRCFRVLGLIGSRLEWGVLLESLKELVLGSALARFCYLFAARIATVTMLKRLFVVQSLSFLVAKRLLLAGSGMTSYFSDIFYWIHSIPIILQLVKI